MAYDFTSYHDRTRTKASKWVMMLAQNPHPSPGTIPMTTADMDFITAPEITQALMDYIPSHILGYSRPTDQYLQSITGYYRRKHGYHAVPEWVFTTSGVMPALATAVRAATAPGDKVLVLSPIYGPFYEVIKGQGRQAVSCPMAVRDSRYYVDFDRFETLCRTMRPALFLLCSPHNPSGRVWTREELQTLCIICVKYNVRIACDEIHSDIIPGGASHTVLHTLAECPPDAILCTSAGKSFNIQGLQCCNVFIKDAALRKHYEEVSIAFGIERANVLGMVATAAAYDHANGWLQAVTEVIGRNHSAVRAFFGQYPAVFDAYPADAGFLAWVNCQGTGLSHEALMRLLVSCDFYVTDGAAFGEGAEHFIRVNVGLPEKALQENLARLALGLHHRLGIE